MSTPAHDVPALPRWEDSGRIVRAVLVAALAAAPVLLVVSVGRLALAGGLRAGHALIVVVALLAADLLSGLVHWSADTWGSERWPVVGPRILRPFRLHHVNPDDLLRRSSVECNGDVAVVCVAVMLTALTLPAVGEPWASLGLFLVSLSGWTLPVNQVHQWAHDADRPAVVRWLQRSRLILSGPAHSVHHGAPYASHYCILTGWWNRPLEALGFFPGVERVISRLTGLRPRDEDEAFASEHLGTAGRA